MFSKLNISTHNVRKDFLVSSGMPQCQRENVDVDLPNFVMQIICEAQGTEQLKTGVS
jgi:hypothetical protein